MSLLKQALVGLSVFVSAAVAQTQQPLTIVVPANFASSAPVFVELRREATRLVSPADYSLDWLTRGAAGNEAFAQLVVVKFRGSCAAGVDEEPPAAQRFGSLATTAVSNGQVLPFIEIDCDRTRLMIAPAVAKLPTRARETLFGRALGRVLAHELYHVLAQTPVHTDLGVAKPCFRMADLIAINFGFDSVSLAQMRIPQLARAELTDEQALVDDAAGR